MPSVFQEEKKVYFPALTGLRAFAAYLVFFHHHAPLVAADTLIAGIARQGYIGVTIFFVLSGFLIYSRYHDRVWLHWKFLIPYLRSRWARIYPLYAIVCLGNLVLMGDRNPKSWFFNMTLLKGMSTNWKFSNVAQSWSLTTEECFYFVFPFIVVLMRKNWPLWSLLFCTYATGLGLYWIGNSHPWEGFFFEGKDVLIYTFWGRAMDFFLGMAIARRVQQQSQSRRKDYGLCTWFGLAITFATMALLAKMGFFGALEMPFGGLVNNILVPPGAAFLVLGLTYESTFLQTILASRLLQFLGKSSYAFYLLQQGFLLRYLSPHPGILFFQIMVLSGLAYLLIEAPIHRALLRGRLLFAWPWRVSAATQLTVPRQGA